MASQPITIDLGTDDPALLSIAGTVYAFRTDVGSKELVATVVPFLGRMDGMDTATDPADALAVVDEVMAVLAQLLVDPEGQAEQWLGLDLPVPAFRQVMDVLTDRWAGEGFTGASS